MTKLWGGQNYTHAESETRKMEDGSLQASKQSGPVALQIKTTPELQWYHFCGAQHHFGSCHAGN